MADPLRQLEVVAVLEQVLREVLDPDLGALEEGLVVEQPGPHALGARGHHELGAARLHQLDVVPRQRLEALAVAVPQQIVAAAALVGRDHRGHAEVVEQLAPRPGCPPAWRARTRGRRRRSTWCSRSRERPRPSAAEVCSPSSSQSSRFCCVPPLAIIRITDCRAPPCGHSGWILASKARSRSFWTSWV